MDLGSFGWRNYKGTFMHIDKRMNIVIAHTRADKSQLFVHSTPISTEIFDKYWEPISEAVSAIFKGEQGIVTGPRIAHKMLRKMAQKLGMWDTPDGVERGLLPEIRRLTHLLVPGKSGWEMTAFESARTSGMLSAREADQIEGRVCFFICCWEILLDEDQPELLDRAAQLWRVQLVSSNCSEYLSSLQTSSAAESSGAMAAA